MTREFERLRDLYWPGRLLDWRVEHRTLSPRLAGCCDYSGRRLLLDLDKFPPGTARRRRITLLHECCHVVRPWGGHDEAFFSEIERLHRIGENALWVWGTDDYDEAALKPFPHCWKRWIKAGDRWRRRLALKREDWDERTLTDPGIEDDDDDGAEFRASVAGAYADADLGDEL